MQSQACLSYAEAMVLLGKAKERFIRRQHHSPSEAAFTLRRSSALFSLWRLIDLIFTISFIRFCFWVIHCWLTAFPVRETAPECPMVLSQFGKPFPKFRKSFPDVGNPFPGSESAFPMWETASRVPKADSRCGKGFSEVRGWFPDSGKG